MPQTFHPFPRLPTELRATIWSYALADQSPSTDSPTSRYFGLYDYDPIPDTVSVRLSPPYPTLFAVCRESRYEAAKQGNGTWIRVNASPEFELCIDFEHDVVHIPNRSAFLSAQALKDAQTMASADEVGLSVAFGAIEEVFPAPEGTCLFIFAHLMPDALKHTHTLVLGTRPHTPHCQPWRGEGIEEFAPGILKRIVLVTASRSWNAEYYALRRLESAWEKEGGHKVPKIDFAPAHELVSRTGVVKLNCL